MSLDRFSEGFASWRMVLASLSDDDIETRAKVFDNAVKDIAGYVAKGLDRAHAVDELHAMAQAYGMIGHYGEDDVQARIARGFEQIERPDHTDEPGKPNGGKAPHENKAPLNATLYVLPDPAMIPPRAWLYGGHYMRGVVTATVAPGGFGKTTLALFEAITMALEGNRVWYISGEDDKVEIDRRIAAHCKFYNIASLPNLFVDDKMSFPFKIAKSGRVGPDFDQPRLLAFEAAIERNGINVVILDPFVAFHLLSENDTAAMDALIKRLAEICTHRNICIEISHHVRKPGIGQVEITVYDARGAAAIVNAVRSCRVLNHMTIEEAQRAQIPPDQRTRYLRVDSGKRNMAPPEKARWHRLMSIQIANGDNVQAADEWEYRTAQATASDVDWLRIIMKDGKKRYRADSRSDEWLGLELATHFGRDPKLKGDVIWINQTLHKWLDEKVLAKVPQWDATQRKDRMFFVLVETEPNPSAEILPFPNPPENTDGDE
jgi:hypothetical protein